jgi:hypothetical protein
VYVNSTDTDNRQLSDKIMTTCYNCANAALPISQLNCFRCHHDVLPNDKTTCYRSSPLTRSVSTPLAVLPPAQFASITRPEHQLCVAVIVNTSKRKKKS